MRQGFLARWFGAPASPSSDLGLGDDGGLAGQEAVVAEPAGQLDGLPRMCSLEALKKAK